MLKTISAALARRFRSRRACACRHAGQDRAGAGEQDHAGARRQGGAGKAKLLNANARMGRHHKHYRHHRHHKHIGLHKTHAKHIAVKHVTPAAKRS